MAEMIGFIIIGLAFYGAYALIRDLRGKVPAKRVQQGITAALGAVMVALALPGQALLAQTAVPVELEIDMNPLFEAINTYLPIMFGIFAVAGGITIAMVLARFLINAIKGAFEGKNL